MLSAPLADGAPAMLRRGRKQQIRADEANRRLERAERELERAREDRAVEQAKTAGASEVTRTLEVIGEQNNIAMLIRRALQQQHGH